MLNQWEALERALPGRERGILRLAGMKLGLCEEERETCLKYLRTLYIHIVEYMSSTQPPLALTSNDKMSFHMVHFKPILYNVPSLPGVPPVLLLYDQIRMYMYYHFHHMWKLIYM